MWTFRITCDQGGLLGLQHYANYFQWLDAAKKDVQEEVDGGSANISFVTVAIWSGCGGGHHAMSPSCG